MVLVPEGGLCVVVACGFNRPATKVTATKTRSRPAPTEKERYLYPHQALDISIKTGLYGVYGDVMKIIKNPELKGILILLLIILGLGAVMAGMSGKLEQWFGLTLFSGPKLQDKIVFVSGGKINVIDKDGSNRTVLPADTEALSAPAISVMGNRIAFVAKRGSEQQVVSIGAEGDDLEQLTSATGPKKEPQYTPDGKQLSFIASGKVYAADLNGDSPETVLPTNEEIRAVMSSASESREIPAYLSYAWANDSKTLAGVIKDQDDNEVLAYIPYHDHSGEQANPGGACPERKALAVGKIAGYAWAASKPTLVATVGMGKKSGLILFDGESKKGGLVLTADKQDFGSPAISPEATEVIIPLKSHDKKAPSGLARLDLKSGKGGIIVKGLFENPKYSPDGSMVVATAIKDDSETDVVLIDLSSGEVKQLTNDGKSHDPIWTPASKK